MTNTADIARAMAATMESASIPMYGNKLRLPDRGAIIALIRELRRLFFPAYFGDPQLMALSAENYAALLLERIETALTAQIALALPESEAVQASQIAQAVVAELPHIQQVLLTDTVGFIRKLPHHLIEAFKSTLEEAKYADYIVHVVDASNPQKEKQMQKAKVNH